jgi:hypothetical protein
MSGANEGKRQAEATLGLSDDIKYIGGATIERVSVSIYRAGDGGIEVAVSVDFDLDPERLGGIIANVAGYVLEKHKVLPRAIVYRYRQKSH